MEERDLQLWDFLDLANIGIAILVHLKRTF